MRALFGKEALATNPCDLLSYMTFILSGYSEASFMRDRVTVAAALHESERIEEEAE